MAGRAPFKLRVLRPNGRAERLRIDFRDLVLHQFQRRSSPCLRIFFQKVEGVAAGAEAVHQEEAKRHFVMLAKVQHLSNYEVEKSESLLDRQQGFGSFESHAGAQATVQLQND